MISCIRYKKNNLRKIFFSLRFLDIRFPVLKKYFYTQPVKNYTENNFFTQL
jgi:hypothetical protein